MILMPRTDFSDSINRVMLSRFDTDIVSLPAVDMLNRVIEKGHMSSVQKAYERVRDDVTRTAKLESHLELTIGARLMLKRNKDVEAGLVNGSVGTVTGFFLSRSEAVYAINIQFDKLDCTVATECETVSFEVLKCVYYQSVHTKTIASDDSICTHSSPSPRPKPTGSNCRCWITLFRL